MEAQKRHAASVFSILEKEVARRATSLLDGSLPHRLRDGLGAPEIQIAVNEAAQVVLVRGGLELKGADYQLLRRLLDIFEEDQRNRKGPEHYRFTSTKTLATKLNVRQPTVHQRVLRIRKRLFEWFAEDYPLPEDALIENSPWEGYRINPVVRLLDLSEMDSADRPSRFLSRTSQLG